MNKIARFILIISLMGSSSCINEPIDKSNHSLSTVGYVRTALSIVVPSNDVVDTRATTAEEESLDLTNIWVLVFNASRQLVEYPILATPAGSTLYITMKSTTQARNIFVTGNLTPAQTAYLANKSNFTLGTTTYDNIANNPAFKSLPIDAAGVPIGASNPIPMFSDEIKLINGTVNTHTLTPNMKRVVAKVNFSAYYIDEADFKIEGMTVINAPRQGLLFQHATLPVDLGGVVQYNEATPSSRNKVESKIYLYENNGMNGATPNPIKIIMRGKYKGSTVDSYYRLDILNTTGTPPFAPSSIVRNTLYTFYIRAVEAPGYDTFAEALFNTPFNNIHYDVTVTDPDIHDIVSNGEYYIGTTNGEYIVYADGLQTNLLAATITTNAPTTLPINRITASGGITCAVSALTLPTTPGSNAKTELRVTFPATFAAGNEGLVEIRLGALSKTIKVRRRASLPSSPEIISDFGTDAYVGASILSPGLDTSWFKLSRSAIVANAAIELSDSISYSTTGIYLQILNDNPLTPTQRSVDVYLNRNSSVHGRAKVHLVQR